jgi:hypothetical protein
MVYTTYKNGELGDGLWNCFTNISGIYIYMQGGAP